MNCDKALNSTASATKELTQEEVLGKENFITLKAEVGQEKDDVKSRASHSKQPPSH